MGRMHWVSSPGTARPSCPHSAGLSCPQKREGRSSIPALFLLAVNFLLCLPNADLMLHAEGKARIK